LTKIAKGSCRRKTWILQHDHDQQGAYNNSVRELECIGIGAV